MTGAADTVSPETAAAELHERTQLRAVAELLGRLLLREVDADELERLRDPALAESLAAIGITLPTAAEQDEWLEQQAARYHELFLRPATGPLVQSLWSEGRYEGDSTVRVRQLARAAGLEFERSAARGAPVDHLGSLCLLWSATDGTAQAIADELSRAHLRWAVQPLHGIEASGGFYGALGSATLELIAALSG